MAEGVEESAPESTIISNKGGRTSEAIAMLSAVLPSTCETSSLTTTSIGFISAMDRDSPTKLAASPSPASCHPSPIHQQQQQEHQPINLKSEEATADNSPEGQRRRNSRDNPSEEGAFHDKSAPPLTHTMDRSSPNNNNNSSHTHLNGSIESILNLQKEASASNIVNSPLNLSTSESSTLSEPNPFASSNSLGNTSQLPQLILASGQITQGLQGAQLLIPTAQGLTTQTILTIPVSQQVSAPIPRPENENNNNNNLLNPNLLSSGVQQLLSVLHPQLFGNSPMTKSFPEKHKASTPPATSEPPEKSMKMSTGPVNLSPKTSSPPLRSSPHFPSYDKFPSQYLTPPTGNSLLNQPHPFLSRSANSSPNPQHFYNRSNSPVSAALKSINRLANSTNGELTITKSSPKPNLSPSSSLASSSFTSYSGHSNSHHRLMHSSSSDQHQKRSPYSRVLETVESEDETSNPDDEPKDGSPSSSRMHDRTDSDVGGINLDEIKEFAKAFKLRRLSMGLTPGQVSQSLPPTEGSGYSQNAFCSAIAAQMYAAQISNQQQAMFEKLEMAPKNSQKVKPVLEQWMKEADDSNWNRFKGPQSHLSDFMGVESSKKRKRRTSFTPQALELLNAHFERNTHPSGTEITGMAHQLGYEREVIRIWFCNKRQALKNTVRQLKVFEN